MLCNFWAWFLRENCFWEAHTYAPEASVQMILTLVVARQAITQIFALLTPQSGTKQLPLFNAATHSYLRLRSSKWASFSVDVSNRNSVAIALSWFSGYAAQNPCRALRNVFLESVAGAKLKVTKKIYDKCTSEHIPIMYNFRYLFPRYFNQ